MASGSGILMSNNVPCDCPLGVCARRLTAERSPRTKMLRASKTLQLENDTRRLRPVSMNPETFDSEPMHGRGQFGVWKSDGNQVHQYG